MRGRLAALDPELDKYKSTGGKQVGVKAYLKQKELKFYQPTFFDFASGVRFANLARIINQLKAEEFGEKETSLAIAGLEPLLISCKDSAFSLFYFPDL